MLRSEIEELERTVKRVFASHCSFGLYTLTSHLRDHQAEDLRRSESIFLTDVRPSEHLNVLTTQSYTTTSRRLLTVLQKTVQRIRSAEWAMSRKRKGSDPVWRGSAEEEAVSGNWGGISV